jgi:transcriptional regulator with XRE-family HTH domain
MEDDFYRILKNKRNEFGFSQTYMADRLGISMKQYQNYEKNTIPPHDKLKMLNEILNYSFHKIIYEEKVLAEIDNETMDLHVRNKSLKEQIELLKERNNRLEQKNDALLRELGAIEQKLSNEQEKSRLSQGRVSGRAG